MGGKACKLNCCGCLRDSNDDIPSSLSQPFYRDPPRAARPKEKKKSKFHRPKFLKRRSNKDDGGGTKKPKNGSKRESFTQGLRVQYSKIPDQDSADLEVGLDACFGFVTRYLVVLK